MVSPPPIRRSSDAARSNRLKRIFRGREESPILYTIVENCRRLGINPKEYLTDVLTRLPGMLVKDAITPTPAYWLKARSGKPARRVA